MFVSSAMCCKGRCQNTETNWLCFYREVPCCHTFSYWTNERTCGPWSVSVSYWDDII